MVCGGESLPDRAGVGGDGLQAQRAAGRQIRAGASQPRCALLTQPVGHPAGRAPHRRVTVIHRVGQRLTQYNLVHDLAALNKTEMLLWEDWGVPDSRTAPGRGELPVLDELATLTGQPSPPLAGLRPAYRRPEFAVPDTVTTYSP